MNIYIYIYIIIKYPPIDHWGLKTPTLVTAVPLQATSPVHGVASDTPFEPGKWREPQLEAKKTVGWLMGI